MAKRASEVFSIVWPILRSRLEVGIGNAKARFYFDVPSLTGFARQLNSDVQSLLQRVSVRLPSLNERDDKIFLAEQYRSALNIVRELSEEDKARLDRHSYFPNNLLDLKQSLERFAYSIEPLQLPVLKRSGRPRIGIPEKIRELRREADLIALLRDWQRSEFGMDLRELKKRHPFLQELFLPPDFFKECRSAFERG